MYSSCCCLNAAIEIVGHESPIIVGLSRIINCSTILNASKIEWVLMGLGSGDSVELSGDGGIFQELSLTSVAIELNGARFTCRVTTVNNRVLEETVTVEVKGKYVRKRYTQIIH